MTHPASTPADDPIEVTFLRDVRHGGDPGQPAAVAALLADFCARATTSLDLAIYDFRLGPELSGPVVSALTEAAARGVTVRIGYDAGKPVKGTAARFAALQADPAPAGTADWITAHFAHTAVRITAIHAAPQLMHSKYLIRDAETAMAAVWTGSANFTDDAWTLQENNIVRVTSPELALTYRADFEQLWATGRITGTGGESATAQVGGASVDVSFAPGGGPAIDAALVGLVDAARHRILIGALVLTSHPLLAALVAAHHRGITISGAYDAGQMGPIVKAWRKVPQDAQVVADFETVATLLSGKHSTPYTPDGPHDFLHDKLLVCDDIVATGSYNFSANAQHNAENQLRITDRVLADRFAAYLIELATAYRGHRYRRHHGAPVHA